MPPGDGLHRVPPLVLGETLEIEDFPLEYSPDVGAAESYVALCLEACFDVLHRILDDVLESLIAGPSLGFLPDHQGEDEQEHAYQEGNEGEYCRPAHAEKLQALLPKPAEGPHLGPHVSQRPGTRTGLEGLHRKAHQGTVLGLCPRPTGGDPRCCHVEEPPCRLNLAQIEGLRLHLGEGGLGVTE